MKTIETPEFTVIYDDSETAANRVADILLKWFLEEEMFSGESIQQMDVTYEDAPDLLSRCAEEGFIFKVTWK